jgi:HPt (histidine-containing phosphotransfer) domain-containing protein
MEIPPKLKENYIRRRQEDILNCEAALKNQDFKTIEVIGHQMKGNGLSFGFESIAILGKFAEVVTQITPKQG